MDNINSDDYDWLNYLTGDEYGDDIESALIEKFEQKYPIYSIHDNVDDMHIVKKSDNDKVVSNKAISNKVISNNLYSVKTGNDKIKGLMQPFSEKKYYKPPPKTSTIAYKLWHDAGVGDSATKEYIEECLNNYVILFNMAEFDIKNNIIRVQFISDTGVKYTFTWDSFIHWMLCSCMFL